MKSTGGGKNEGNRTTANNAWKPPPSEGTTSPQRALRWQAAAPGQEPEAAEPNYTTERTDDSRSEKSTKSGSTNRTSKTDKSSSKSSRRKKGKEAEKVDEGPKEPGLVEWYGDPLVPGIDASLGPQGSLYSFTKSNGPRPGMCNPPMSDAVRKLLVADLNEWKVEPIVSKKGKQKQDGGEEKPARKNKIVIPQSRAARSSRGADEDASVDANSAGASGMSTTLPAGFGGASGSSRLSSPGPNLRRTTSTGSHAHRSGASPSVKTKKKKGESTWQLDDLTQEGKPKKHGLDTAPEGEVKWRSHNLRLKAREHGFVLEKMSVEECGVLSKYHNWFSRGPLQHPMPVVHPVHPSRQLKDLGGDLHATHTHSLHNVSTDTLQHVADTAPEELEMPRKQPPRRGYNIGPSASAPSMERLMEMCNTVRHAGPHEFQMRCAAARISVHTGSRLPESSMDGSQREFDNDPLFSARLGATPRTSTGKPLPVPFWGRNGSAPVLQHTPQLQQARPQAAEGSR